MRILIVEDHLDSAELMARLLRRAGHHVQITQSVTDALHVAKADGETFDLVLSDVSLPDGSGLELMPKLREAGVRHGIAISGTADDATRAGEAGFNAHLLKPVQFDQLLALIGPLPRG
jgi:CheY-like chemotaxis protein